MYIYRHIFCILYIYSIIVLYIYIYIFYIYILYYIYIYYIYILYIIFAVYIYAYIYICRLLNLDTRTHTYAYMYTCIHTCEQVYASTSFFFHGFDQWFAENHQDELLIRAAIATSPKEVGTNHPGFVKTTLDRLWIDFGHCYICTFGIISPSSFWKLTLLPNTQPFLLPKGCMCPVLCCLVHVICKTAGWLESRSEVDRPAMAFLLILLLACPKLRIAGHTRPISSLQLTHAMQLWIVVPAQKPLFISGCISWDGGTRNAQTGWIG